MSNTSEKVDARLRSSTTQQESASRKRLSSRELFGALREVVIDHVGEEYRLRITSQGKLILTK